MSGSAVVSLHDTPRSLWCTDPLAFKSLPKVRPRVGQKPTKGKGQIIYRGMVDPVVLQRHPTFAVKLYDDLPLNPSAPTLEQVLDQSCNAELKARVDARMAIILDDDYLLRRASARQSHFDALAVSTAVNKRSALLAAQKAYDAGHPVSFEYVDSEGMKRCVQPAGNGIRNASEQESLTMSG